MKLFASLALFATLAGCKSTWTDAPVLMPAREFMPGLQPARTEYSYVLCGELVPNVDAITACMIQKKAQLSPQCRAFFRPEPGEAAAQPAGQPVSIKPVIAKKKTSSKPAAAKKATASKKSKKPNADET